VGALPSRGQRPIAGLSTASNGGLPTRVTQKSCSKVAAKSQKRRRSDAHAPSDSLFGSKGACFAEAEMAQTNPPAPASEPAPLRSVQVTLTLTLGAPGAAGWQARVLLPDSSVRDFASPFELVRYLSWPMVAERRRGGGGLR